MERGLQLRSQLLQAKQCSFSVEISAEYEDSIHNFAMDCQGDPEGNLTFVVTEPESIAGISGKLTGEGGQLLFDDTALHFPLLAEGQLSPVSAPWILIHTLRSGYLSSAGVEDGFLRLTAEDSYEDDALRLDIWLNDQNLPDHGDVLYNGSRILRLSVRNFSIL